MKLDSVIARFADYADDAFLIAEGEPTSNPGPRILWANKAFERMTGYTREDIIGQTPRILQGPDTSAEARSNIRSALEEWRTVRQEVLNYRKDGTPFWVELIIHPVADETGWVHYWVAIQRNVTERKLRELEVEEARRQLQIEVAERREAEDAAARHAAELEVVNAELERFATIASHDLQAPARKIRGFAQLLADQYGEADERAQLYARFLVESSDRLQQLVSALLRYAHAGAGASLIKTEPVDLSKTVAAAAAVFSETIGQTKARVVSDALPVIRGDHTLLGQLFENLIGNALKYRGEKPPHIAISAMREPANGGVAGWRVSVADNGIGFPAQDAERIFEALQRLHRADDYPGTGLGLAICRRIVARHGGRIWAEPRSEGGAIFHMVFPSLETKKVHANDAVPTADGKATA